MSITDPILSLNIEAHSQLVKDLCNDKDAINKAREIVPFAELIEDCPEILENEFAYQEKLLELLTVWFRNNFFQWFKPPVCCDNEMVYHTDYVNIQGLKVEQYKCLKCNGHHDFVRYNEGAILLDTREGRCGEWAYCFFVILKAFDFDVRLIFDSTDHVWNEVWSISQERWIHVDACEQAIDKPLMYEIGWSKKLVYCIAYSDREILDVTKRYTTNYNEVLYRRAISDDSWLNSYLDNLTEGLMGEADDETCVIGCERRLMDIEALDSFVKNPRPIPSKSDFECRKTGNIEWRIQRGEYNPSADMLVVIKAAITNPDASNNCLFSLTYNCDKNKYKSSVPEYCDRNWSSLTYSFKNVDFKYEKDWRTSYIARYETCPHDKSGILEWRFDLSSLGDQWTKLEIKICGMEYPETSIDLVLIQYDEESKQFADSMQMKLNEINIITRASLSAPNGFLGVKATLSGGEAKDSVSWQKPQLFRQTKEQNSDENMFSVLVF